MEKARCEPVSITFFVAILTQKIIESVLKEHEREKIEIIVKN